jgi:hypothetical protein
MPTAAFVTWPWWPKTGLVPASAAGPALAREAEPARSDAGPVGPAGSAAAVRPTAQGRACAVHATA